MPPSNADVPDAQAVAWADLDHVLRNALTIIRGRAHRMQRTIIHGVTLTEVQSARVLGDLAAIDAAVVAMVTELDARGPRIIHRLMG